VNARRRASRIKLQFALKRAGPHMDAVPVADRFRGTVVPERWRSYAGLWVTARSGGALV
jgi:hypothetical protein